VKYSALRSNDIFLPVVLHGILQHHSRRSFHVGNGEHRTLTLQMCHHDGTGMLLLQLRYSLHGELLVNVASAVPQQHVASGHRVDVRPEVMVRTEYYLLILWERVYHLLRVAARNDHIGECLHRGCGVDIAHHLVAGVLLLEPLQVLRAAGVGKRASGIEVGREHFLLRTEQLACLRHEMHAAHHDDVSVCRGSLTCQRERVAYEVGALLHLSGSVIVCEQHGVLLRAHPSYLFSEVGAFLHRLIGITFLNPFLFHHFSLHIYVFLYDVIHETHALRCSYPYVFPFFRFFPFCFPSRPASSAQSACLLSPSHLLILSPSPPLILPLPHLPIISPSHPQILSLSPQSYIIIIFISF